jgi:hypothetical protein
VRGESECDSEDVLVDLTFMTSAADAEKESPMPCQVYRGQAHVAGGYGRHDSLRSRCNRSPCSCEMPIRNGARLLTFCSFCLVFNKHCRFCQNDGLEAAAAALEALSQCSRLARLATNDHESQLLDALVSVVRAADRLLQTKPGGYRSVSS